MGTGGSVGFTDCEGEDEDDMVGKECLLWFNGTSRLSSNGSGKRCVEFCQSCGDAVRRLVAVNLNVPVEPKQCAKLT